VKEPIMQRIMQRVLGAGLAVTAACRLDPLVDDKPGASANILPSDAKIPAVADNPDLLTQITLNDSLDTKALTTSMGLIVRGTGFSDGNPVKFWAFGASRRAPAPIYVFGTGDALTSFQPNDHLPLVDALPGDTEYNPIHTIYRVVVTDRYHGEKITTTGALADAIQIGLVEEPVSIKSFIDGPIVRPGTMIELGTTTKAAPTQIYGRGHIADIYVFGGGLTGGLGMQLNPFGLLPTSQVSFLRTSTGATYDPERPIFQATIPAPGKAAYTPLSIVINVDLSPGAGTITKDADLFMRSPPTTGTITATQGTVAQFAVTATTLLLQLQFAEDTL
jgi:hypothetical protein